MKLQRIVKSIINEATDKNILTSNPSSAESKRFQEVTKRLMQSLKKSQVMERSILYNKDLNDNLFTPATVVRGDITQHLGEYDGPDFKSFAKSISSFYEKAGFKVEEGYGIDKIKGFEVKDNDGETIGEVDFLLKNSIPKLGDTVIVKYKKQ